MTNLRILLLQPHALPVIGTSLFNQRTAQCLISPTDTFVHSRMRKVCNCQRGKLHRPAPKWCHVANAHTCFLPQHSVQVSKIYMDYIDKIRLVCTGSFHYQMKSLFLHIWSAFLFSQSIRNSLNRDTPGQVSCTLVTYEAYLPEGIFCLKHVCFFNTRGASYDKWLIIAKRAKQFQAFSFE